MTYPPELRRKALALRTDEALTIDQIADRLAVSRTTAFSWVGDVPIGRTSRQTAAQQRATRRMQRRFRQAREEAYAMGRAEFDELSTDPTFRDFVCMYIGEGFKRTRHKVSIANSDPAVIVLGDRWIRRFARNPVTYSVQYHADQDLFEVRRFWARLLGADPDAIRLQRKSNSNALAGRKWRSRHGVLTVTACDTHFRARLEGWIDCVKESWA